MWQIPITQPHRHFLLRSWELLVRNVHICSSSLTQRYWLTFMTRVPFVAMLIHKVSADPPDQPHLIVSRFCGEWWPSNQRKIPWSKSSNVPLPRTSTSMSLASFTTLYLNVNHESLANWRISWLTGRPFQMGPDRKWCHSENSLMRSYFSNRYAIPEFMLETLSNMVPIVHRKGSAYAPDKSWWLPMCFSPSA